MALLKPFKKPQQLLHLLSPLSPPNAVSISSSTKPTQPQNPQPKLTREELTTVNLLLPRLCLSNNLTTAINLTITSLSTNPPPKSISLNPLIHSLTSQPDLTLPMSFLTRLRHTPPVHSHLKPITSLMILSYVKKGRCKDGLKVYKWVCRPGSVCEVEGRVYGVLVGGCCKEGLLLEGLRVLRDMLGEGAVGVGEGLRRKVVGSLLREARVGDAMELDEALVGAASGGGAGGDDSLKKVLGLLDEMIANWTE